MSLKARVVLIVELAIGLVPISALYLYMFPAGVFWLRGVIQQTAKGILNTFTMVMAAAFVMGGVGLLSLWIAMARRLLGRGLPGRLLLSGILAGVAASITVLSVTTIIGAFWIDYFLHGGPLLVAAHQIVSAVRSRGARSETVAAIPGR